MAAHNETGKRGEEIAAQYLLKKGYKILDKNWRYFRNEIDIVALDGIFLVVAEVKTRSSDKMMPPEMAVDWLEAAAHRMSEPQPGNAPTTRSQEIDSVMADAIAQVLDKKPA